MKTQTLFFLLIISYCSISAQSLNVDPKFPVSRNFAYFEDESNILKFKTVFNISAVENNSVDINSVKYKGIVQWVDNSPREEISGTLHQIDDQLPDFVTDIKGGNQVSFKKKPQSGRVWDNINIAISYKLNGVVYTLPNYIIYSDNAQQAKATKLILDPIGFISSDGIGTILVKVAGVASVKLTTIQVKNSTTGAITQTQFNTNEIIGSSSGYKLPITLGNPNPGMYHVKISATTIDDSPITSVEADINFQRQISITQINGSTSIQQGYEFNLSDKKNNTYTINTVGEGVLDVINLSANYQVSIKTINPGVCELTVVSEKVILGDEQRIIITSNEKPIAGTFILKRPYPEMTMIAEQSDVHNVKFSMVMPDWITNDVSMKIPGNGTKFVISNSDITASNGKKTFSQVFNKSNFGFNDKSDSTIISNVDVFLGERKLFTAQYKFLNLKYYEDKIKTAQTSNKKSGDKKEEIKNIISSLFKSTTGSDSADDVPMIKSIIKNLASGKTEDKGKGWNQVLSFAVKLAPALIAII